jgi:uroporphyrinogen III methyltransferase/synthase
MGVTTVGDWSRRLISAGKSPETPVALVRRCSWPDQETILCNLGEAAAKMTPASKFRPPVLVVIGPVAHLGAPFNWFQKRPLFGKKILLCRPQDESEGTAEELESLGATVHSQPALRVEPPEDWIELDREIERLSQYQWIVFSSRFGVRALLDRIHSLGKDSRVLGNCRLAGVGPSIREELEKYQLRADKIAGSPFGAKPLLELLLGRSGILAEKTTDPKSRFLIVGNNRTDPFLGLELASSGFEVSTVAAYRTLAVPYPAPLIAEKLRAGSIHYCLATSPAIARTLVEWFGKELSKTKIASISPAVTAIFEGLDLKNIVEAKEASIAGIVASIRNDYGLELDKTGDAS